MAGILNYIHLRRSNTSPSRLRFHRSPNRIPTRFLQEIKHLSDDEQVRDQGNTSVGNLSASPLDRSPSSIPNETTGTLLDGLVAESS